MGTNYNGEGHQGGVIPNVMDTIFSKMESTNECTEFLVRVSFIEVEYYKFNVSLRLCFVSGVGNYFVFNLTDF